MKILASIRRCSPGWLSIAGVLLLLGCETIVEIKDTGYRPELAVRSFFHPGQAVWSAEVRQTVPLSDRFAAVDDQVVNATVEILYEGEVIATLAHQARGQYEGNGLQPQAGQAYTLRVSAPGFRTITASSRLPDFLAAVPTVDFRESQSEGLALFDLRFEDRPERNDYYRLRVLHQNGITLASTYESQHPALPRTSFRELIRTEGVDRLQYQAPLFTDQTFAGQTFEATLSTYRRPGYAYEIELALLSEDFYRYQRALALIEQIEDNPFAEPVIVYSNVDGGAGVFAGFIVQPIPPILLNEITPERISGTYEAVEMRNARTGEDLLSGGSRLMITLTADQRFTGEILIPSTVHPEGTNVDVTLNGHYRIIEGRIYFDQPDAPFVGETGWYYIEGPTSSFLRMLEPSLHSINMTIQQK